MVLNKKKILLGITGGIAAYKVASLVRLLVKSNAEVKIVMTPSAKAFITPLTLATLSKNEVASEFFNSETGVWENHVAWGLWADLLLIAPATANTIANFAAGNAQDLLSAIYLSARCKVMLAPAMDLDMYTHPATQYNLSVLKQRGNIVIDPASGELASGLSGKGRLPEPEELLTFVESFFANFQSLKNKKIAITAGPTYEAIDPVRFIGNRSTGKMGYAIADALVAKGAEVYLITGPTNVPIPFGLKEVVKVESAMQMFEATQQLQPEMDAMIFTAAVADYRVENAGRHSESRPPGARFRRPG